MFNRQHYVAIAVALRNSKAPPAVVVEFSKMFASDNDRFDEVKFVDACVPDNGLTQYETQTWFLEYLTRKEQQGGQNI